MDYPIGAKAYPVDNSYSFTIRTSTNPYLAGYLNQIPPAKKVTIVSNPYKLKRLNSGGVWIEDKFVTVSYKRKCHVVLNIFTKNKPTGYPKF